MGQTLVYQARPFSLAYWKLELTDLGELSIHWQEVQLPIYVPEIKLLRYYFV